ncbi:hypothetical protein HOC35_01925 [Candidatus Woesearchaeota archaeon]|jgi:hypothetical protein|nr:hypothetical protein [Candidatus Woesearchaeota archaeon]
MDQEDEKKLKQKITEIETNCINQQLDLIMSFTKTTNRDLAYNLLMKYRDIWEFTSNVSTSGDSLVITLPKKEAKQKGIEKGTPIFIALKKLRFFSASTDKKVL